MKTEPPPYFTPARPRINLATASNAAINEAVYRCAGLDLSRETHGPYYPEAPERILSLLMRAPVDSGLFPPEDAPVVALACCKAYIRAAGVYEVEDAQ